MAYLWQNASIIMHTKNSKIVLNVPLMPPVKLGPGYNDLYNSIMYVFTFYTTIIVNY